MKSRSDCAELADIQYNRLAVSDMSGYSMAFSRQNCKGFLLVVVGRRRALYLASCSSADDTPVRCPVLEAAAAAPLSRMSANGSSSCLGFLWIWPLSPTSSSLLPSVVSLKIKRHIVFYTCTIACMCIMCPLGLSPNFSAVSVFEVKLLVIYWENLDTTIRNNLPLLRRAWNYNQLTNSSLLIRTNRKGYKIKLRHIIHNT